MGSSPPPETGDAFHDPADHPPGLRPAPLGDEMTDLPSYVHYRPGVVSRAITAENPDGSPERRRQPPRPRSVPAAKDAPSFPWPPAAPSPSPTSTDPG